MADNINISTERSNEQNSNDVIDFKRGVNIKKGHGQNDNLLQCGETAEDEKEGVRSWAVCFAAFCIILMRNGLLVTNGVMLSSLLKEFKQSKSKTAWVGSIAAFFAYLLGPVASILSNRVGSHVVIITGGLLCSVGLVLTSFATRLAYMWIGYGFVVGFGCCMCYTPVQIVLSSHFHKNRSLAMTIAASGSNVGMLIMGPLITQLLQLYGLKMTYRILAIQGILIAILGLAFRPSVSSRHKHQKKKPSFREVFKVCFDRDLLKSKEFLSFAAAVTAYAFGFYVPRTFLMKYASEIGVQQLKSSQLFIYLAIAAIFGKFLIGIVSRTGKIRATLLCQICMFSSGLTAILSSFSSSFTSLVLFATFYGLSDGAYGGIISFTASEIAGQEKMNQAWGNLLCFESLAFLLGPPFTGVFVDVCHTSKPMFYVTGIFAILGSLLLFFITCSKPKNPELLPLIEKCEISEENIKMNNMQKESEIK